MMPAIYKPGKKVGNYAIEAELSRGAFANSYKAKDKSGNFVFFKQYKSPTKLVSWYDGFVVHQKEIKSRINNDPAAKDRCYQFLDFFDDPSGFHQVFEFISGGKVLTDVIINIEDYTYDELSRFAKVMMFGVRALHTIEIVHTDLKPDNIILIPDLATNNYKLRIIDLDWSIFSTKPAPWNGVQGYIGTPGYQSPEHLRGDVPVPASDIFTCGIMLGEILGGGHPFAASGENYDQDVQKGKFSPIVLRSAVPGVSDGGFVEKILNACLDPLPGNRPTAVQVCDALIGKAPPRDTPSPNVVCVDINFNGKFLTKVSVASQLGKRHFKGAHADVQFLSDPQFSLTKNRDEWFIEHVAGAVNETIVNGVKLNKKERVRDGMEVSVGNSAKGVKKFPLILRLV